eukprot:TRINITY_DN22943_c3_g1_i1.p1 TRINITY_DN22943_c3_g1~~TRINITY_DN22943_c3_g1_i1.p1  ORF type:complete len:130 (+),score=23.57 TRINITY_DN22943_c3_g1_i1:661-1050(+)
MFGVIKAFLRCLTGSNLEVKSDGGYGYGRVAFSLFSTKVRCGVGPFPLLYLGWSLGNGTTLKKLSNLEKATFSLGLLHFNEGLHVKLVVLLYHMPFFKMSALVTKILEMIQDFFVGKSKKSRASFAKAE